ncbi:hypothetical protein EHQ16_12640 [Leptospira kanakyensis]|uniref:6-bladed beta-propeller n=1 Tax=Leptospira kanakyensis TaxID=2484968 RepID=A0A6N4Q9S3_9LEPT|nr:hypothetical protein [Leptospira kanakyensis]TGK50043.1 hypothetical protein EHQ11_09980 [Leptospira kanakyensis]TGK58439.1 hypothetical protein EHQ16_12640 [Leptospira kanakyensis]TGK69181.1 hypothetical protein EHQ18_10140 [Leptospira kanakyensis]
MKQMIIKKIFSLSFTLLIFYNCDSGNDNKDTQNLLFLSLLNNGSTYTSNVKVSLYAGSSQRQSGGIDGDRFSATFNRPRDLVYVSSDKSLLIVDNEGRKIRKIDASGSVSTFAGALDGSFGDTDGIGTNARFKNILGITRCPDGYFYVADSSNSLVRKISEAAVVTKLTGGYGNVDGNLAAARFGILRDITCDNTGNLFVTDGSNHSIRKIDTSGNVTTYAGSTSGVAGLVDGVGNDARFTDPNGISFDPISGNLYVLGCCGSFAVIDQNRKVTFVTKVLGYVNGNISQAKFSSPTNLVNDVDGDFIIADSVNNAIRKYTRVGEVSTFAGTTFGEFGLVDGYGTQARFNEPSGIVAGEGRTFFVTDYRNHVIRKIEY